MCRAFAPFGGYAFYSGQLWWNLERAPHTFCIGSLGYGKFSLRLIESTMFGATFNLVTLVGLLGQFLQSEPPAIQKTNMNMKNIKEKVYRKMRKD